MDRAVATEDWRDKFPLTTVTHLSSHASDHALIILQTRTGRKFQDRRNYGFKFEESWLLWNDCEAVVKDAWEKNSDGSSTLATTKKKIKLCGAELQTWGASKTHPNSKEIKRLQKRVEELNFAECTVENRVDFLG